MVEKDSIDTEPDIAQVLGIDEEQNTQSLIKPRWRTPLISALLIVVVVIGFRSCAGDRGPVYRTLAAQTGDLTVTVSATGTLEPVNEVKVGIEVSGTISEVFVDHNDTVKKGQLLAKLDTTILEAEVAQLAASVKSAEASLAQAKATLAESKSQYDRLIRLRELSEGALPSQRDLDTARASLDRAKASVTSEQARVVQSEAQLVVRQTQLQKAQVTSPINGVILSRLVDPGQTVAATLQTPELFVIAENLAEMELHVDVDEADVGQVVVAQPATFTVDAYPDEAFPASITEVLFAPNTSEGVVTYAALLAVNNEDLRLRPGMTATATITVRTVENALLIPNEALRYSPPALAKQKGRGGMVSLFSRGPGDSRDNSLDQQSNNGPMKQVWALEDDAPYPVAVRTGFTDGYRTELVSGGVSAGTMLIVGQTSKQ